MCFKRRDDGRFDERGFDAADDHHFSDAGGEDEVYFAVESFLVGAKAREQGGGRDAIERRDWAIAFDAVEDGVGVRQGQVSGDATAEQGLEGSRDVRTQVASEVYGVPLAEVTKAMRRSAKAINFGVIYGQSPFGLAKSIDIKKSEAAKFIDAYFAGYPGVDEFMRQVGRASGRDRV